MIGKKNNKEPKSEGKSYEELGKMLVSIYESGYINQAQSYKMSFLKGLVGGLGGVIGATIIVALLIGLLSLFEDIPLIGRLFDNLRETIESRRAR